MYYLGSWGTSSAGGVEVHVITGEGVTYSTLEWRCSNGGGLYMY